MNCKLVCVVVALVVFVFKTNAQKKDSVIVLKEVSVTGYKTMNGIGHLLDVKDAIVYAGKKTEVIIIDSLDANKAINNTRQILGRIPGLNIVESESSGFTANGIATRGLDPNQSIEMNTRQNGYNISADVYGYNEAYYIPAMEAVKRIELVRGASSLQFGVQFGGMVNYITEDVPSNIPLQLITSQTLGSFGLNNSFFSIGGNHKKFSFYGFLQKRNIEGYRPNSKQSQLSSFGKIAYIPSDKLTVSVEYSSLRNIIQMPGGLSDSLFNANPKASLRARNWLKSPWNIISNSITYKPSINYTYTLTNTFLFSNRSLVWRNEDGGPSEMDNIDPSTHQYVPREVESEDMHNLTTEGRLAINYMAGKYKSTLSAGFKASYAWFKRFADGDGTTGSDFDLSITGDWGKNLDFTTTNIAPFIENVCRISNKLTITPGIRIEWLKNTTKGYITDSIFKEYTNQNKDRLFILSGIGVEFKPKSNINFYGNISQSYRPIDYSQLSPFGVAAKIDPNMKDQFGYNTDLGCRGTVKNYLNFDVSMFYVVYNNRIGDVIKTDNATQTTYAYRTNIANSVHKGIEYYIEFNILKYLKENNKKGLSIFNSYSYVNATYTSGIYKGNRVAEAAKQIERMGIIYKDTHFSSTFQLNYVGDAYGDATNVKVSDNPIAGYIPCYTVLDLSATYRIKNYAVKAGINNLSNTSYFTRRTDEYPGPGIIPAVGRSFYVGFTTKF